MIVGIPTLDGKGLDSEVSEHFGHAPYFTVIEINKEKPRDGEVKKNLYTDDECKVTVVLNQDDGPHTCAAPVNKLMAHNINILLVSGIGGGPFNMFKNNGVELYAGAIGTVREALRDLLCGMLSRMGQSSCGTHQGADDGCGHHH